jgi:hypothetical protein
MIEMGGDDDDDLIAGGSGTEVIFLRWYVVKPDDKVITAYRCHPFAVLRGGTIKGVIAELLGKPPSYPHRLGDLDEVKISDQRGMILCQAERTGCRAAREDQCTSSPPPSSE